MFSNNSLLAVSFMVLVVTVLILLMERNEVGRDIKDDRKRDQDMVQNASRLVIQSVTQTHIHFKLEHVVEAKALLQQLIEKYGTVRQLEKTLKLETGKAAELQSSIDYQYNKVCGLLMDKFIRVDPSLKLDLNGLAGLEKKAKKRRSSSSSRRHRE